MDYIRLETSSNELRVIFLKGELVFNTTSFILEYIQKVGNMWLRRGRTQKIELDLKYLSLIRTRCLPFTNQKDVVFNTSKMEAVYGSLPQNGWPNRLEKIPLVSLKDISTAVF